MKKNKSKESILMDIGLTKNEAKIYCALIELGSSSAGRLAEISKIHRANVYDALERLFEKGIVSYVMKDKTKIFEATDPKNLLGFLKEKEDVLKEVIPQFELARKFNPKSNEAQVFEGVSALMRILYNFLEYKQEILVYGLPKVAPEMVTPHGINPYHEFRAKNKVVMKHIYNQNAQQRIAYLNKLPYTEAKYLPLEYNSLVSTFICGDEVVLTTWTKPMVSIRIVNKLLAESYRNYFYF